MKTSTGKFLVSIFARDPMPGELKVSISASGSMPVELKLMIFAQGPMPGELKQNSFGALPWAPPARIRKFLRLTAWKPFRSSFGATHVYWYSAFGTAMRCTQNDGQTKTAL